ncbi:MAG: hypothetical protein ABIJ09_13760 [Pseudomonadota bacterium]
MTGPDDPRDRPPRATDEGAATVHDAGPGRRKTMTFNLPAAASAMSAQLGKVTEVRIVNTAFGPAKLQEAAKDKRFMIMRKLDSAVTMVPYVDRDMIGGAYCVAQDRAMTMGPGVMRYPVLDVIPAIFLDLQSRTLITSQLQAAGLTLRFPEEVDLTVSVRDDLMRSTLVWCNPAASVFTLEGFVHNLLSVRASPQFERVYLIEMHDGARYIMALERSIESVIELHPYFQHLDQQAAVRLRYRDSDNTWLAPMRSGV